MSESGVYLTFYDEEEPPEKQLPALGPFEELIVRHNRIIGEREDVEHELAAVESVERWLEAELELKRALGSEPGGTKRSHMRIRAPRGDILVRFYDYSGDQPPAVPELGPFYAVTIGSREVRADDKLLATRASDIAPWTLTDAVRSGVAGVMKADFSLFTAAAREFVSAARAVGTSAAPRPVAPDLAPAHARTALELAALDSSLLANGAEPAAPPAFTPADVQLFEQVEQLRAADLAQALMVERLRKQQKVDPERSLRAKVAPASTAAMRFQPPVSERAPAEEVEEKPDPLAARIWDVLWPLRNLIIGALVLAAVASVYGYVRPAPGDATKEKVTLVNLGERVFTDDWVIVANSLDRVGALGPVPPRNGVYLVVRITVTKKSDSAVILEPTDFTVVDQAGLLTPAQEPTSSVYSTAESNTQLGWSQSYPAGIPVRDPLVFDVSPTVRDLKLLIRGSTVGIRLPN